jgi:hypothetical protein
VGLIANPAARHGLRHLKLALFGFVFPGFEDTVCFHNSLLDRSLNSFWLFGNWVRFA